MYDIEFARSEVDCKMARYTTWSVYSISEDDNYYYFIYGINGQDGPDGDFPVIRFNKSTGVVDAMSIERCLNFKAVAGSRMIYHRKNIKDLNVAERNAVNYKYKAPDSTVFCPRCGKQIKYMKKGKNVTLFCEGGDCISSSFIETFC